MRGVSLFSGAGIGETYLCDCGIDIVVANELIPKRANLYRRIFPNTAVICGDITKNEIYNEIIRLADGKIDFLIASPPCQGMSVAGKNRSNSTMIADDRNYLINYIIKAIKDLSPKYVLIENVPMLLNIQFMCEDKHISIEEMF